MYYCPKVPSLAETYGKTEPEIPPVTEGTPRFRDIHISNIVCDGAEEGIFVRGLPEMSIQDIHLDNNMVLKADRGAELTAAAAITLNHMRLVTKAVVAAIAYGSPGTSLFSINGARCADIQVEDTDQSKAAQSAEFHYGARAEALKK